MTKATILNTRPTEADNNTHKVFVKHGFNVIDFPCIDIKTVKQTETIIQQLAKISENNAIVFTSQHAVKHAYKIQPDLQLPKSATVITVGTKTAHCLEQNAHTDIWIPEQQNSQGVIDLLTGIKNVNTIHIITAANGRTKIQQYAQSQNITLQQINVYMRGLPVVSDATISNLMIQEGLFVLVTSVGTLVNLEKLLPKSIWNKLKECELICASQRIATYAKKLNFTQVRNVETANPEKIASIVSSS